jgi:hypothetical protein
MKELGVLSLPSNGMKTLGKSASSLTKLKNLNYFSVASNQIAGAIPQWVGALAPLKMPGKDIYLQSNRFTGPIPTSLSVLSVGSFRPGNPGLCGKPLAACPKY